MLTVEQFDAQIRRLNELGRASSDLQEVISTLRGEGQIVAQAELLTQALAEHIGKVKAECHPLTHDAVISVDPYWTPDIEGDANWTKGKTLFEDGDQPRLSVEITRISTPSTVAPGVIWQDESPDDGKWGIEDVTGFRYLAVADSLEDFVELVREEHNVEITY